MKYGRILSKIFFPERCPLCGRILSITEELCFCCGKDEVKLHLNCCEHCGNEKELCSCERKYSSALPHITGAFIYDGLVQNKLLFFKFGGHRYLYRFFGDSLSERIAVTFASADFDTVTFVPASKVSAKSTDYNPSQLIAERTAKRLFLPCKELLVKSRETEKQHKLNARERFTNVKGSFSAKDGAEIKGRTILLCDDIKTTGATLKECSDVLFGMGARDVYCAVVAVTSNLNFFDLDKRDKIK